MTPTGSSAGLPRNAADRADLAWVQETARAAIAARPAHKAMVLAVGNEYFRPWCSTCAKYVGNKGRDKAWMRYMADAHQREKNQ